MTAMEALVDKLYGPNGLGVTNIKFSRGTRSDVTAEEIVSELLRLVTNLEQGNFEVVSETD